MDSTLVTSVKEAYAAVESNDISAYVQFFTADGIRALAEPLVDMFESVTHDITTIWELDNTVICEMNVTYNRKDGKSVTVPCVDVIHFTDGKVNELKAYIDTSPAFS